MNKASGAAHRPFSDHRGGEDLKVCVQMSGKRYEGIWLDIRYITSKIVAFPMPSTRIESSCRQVGRFFISTSFWPVFNSTLMRLLTCTQEFRDCCLTKRDPGTRLSTVSLKNCHSIHPILVRIILNCVSDRFICCHLAQ